MGNSKDNSFFKSRVNSIYIILLVVTLFFYFKGLHERFSLCDVTIYECVVVAAIVAVIAICLFVSSKDNKDVGLFPMLFVVFLVYSLRAPGDLFGTYLWAEDGTVLLQNAMYDGVRVLITPTSGTYWTIQKLIGLLCYWICYMLKNLMIFPALESIASKIVASFGVCYFLSNRFKWLIESRSLRFIVCIVVVLAIPYYATDVITCDTSLPFVLNFTVFLIGMDTICRPESRTISWKETSFLCLHALSTAAAPFVALVAGLSLISWGYVQFRSKTLKTKPLLIELLKMGIICICVLIQVMCALCSSRVNGDLELIQRLITCLKDFVFFPYAYTFENVKLMVVAFIAFVVLALLTKTSWKVIIYSSVFSYCFSFYCSMLVAPDEITNHIWGEYNGGARYIMLLYMIAAFVIGIEICNLWNDSPTKRITGVVLFSVMMFVSMITYSLPIVGSEYIDSYQDSICVYDPEGKDPLTICIAPWGPYSISIPCDISSLSESDDREIQDSIGSIGGIPYIDYRGQYGSYTSLEGWVVPPDDASFEYLFIEREDASYLAPIRFDKTDNSYLFYLSEDDLRVNVIQFVGITDSGIRYCWNTNIS